MKKYLTIILCLLTFNLAAQKQINIVYFNGFKPIVAANITAALQQVYKCKILQKGQYFLPQKAYYKPRNRYRADILLDYLENTNTNIYTLGVTSQDISCTNGNITDWGVLGLGRYNSCVVSSFRLNSTLQLVKVAVHEVGHAFGLDHCLDDKCVMNAGDGTLENLDYTNVELCSKCKQIIGL